MRAMAFFRAALLVLLASFLDRVVDSPGDEKTSRFTGSLSLLQATSSKSRTILEGEEELHHLLNSTGHLSRVHLSEARSPTFFQTAVQTVEVQLSLSKVKSAVGTVTVLILGVLVLSAAAFLLLRPDAPSKEPSEVLVKKDHLQLPADALTKPRGSRATFVGSPIKGRSPMGRSPCPSEDEPLHFCPDLIVPRGCECVLLVPIVPLCLGPFSVCDPNGHVVLRITPKSGGASPSPAVRSARPSVVRKSVTFGPESLGSSWRIELSTGAGEFLAQSSFCKAGKSPHSSTAGAASFALMRADGAHYATLQRNPQEGYELTLPDGMIYFWGSFDHHAVNITDEGGKLLATTELCCSDWDPTGEFYRLRVAPMVDVGLLLCSLVCIDQVSVLKSRT